MTAPTQYPFWATSPTIDPETGNLNVEAPPGNLQQVGYVTNAVPNASTWNYMMNLQGQWIQYLSGVASRVAPMGVITSDGAAKAMLPTASSLCVVFASNNAGSYGLYIGYQATAGGTAALSSVGGGTIAIASAAGGILSANDPANPSATTVVAAFSLTA